MEQPSEIAAVDYQSREAFDDAGLALARRALRVAAVLLLACGGVRILFALFYTTTSVGNFAAGGGAAGIQMLAFLVQALLPGVLLIAGACAAYGVGEMCMALREIALRLRRP